MDAIGAFIAYIAICLVQQIVNQVHVMMSLVTVWKDVIVAFMVHNVKTLVPKTVIHRSVTRTQAIVTLGVLLASLAKSAMSHVLRIVWVVVNKPVDTVQHVKKVSLVENVRNFALQIVKMDVVKIKEFVKMAAYLVSMVLIA